MKVKVKCGTLGWKDADGRIRLKKPGEFCEVEDAEGERLISLGAVEAAEEAENEKPEEDPKGNPEEDPEEEREEQMNYDRETLEGMRLAGLRILCEKHGIKNARRMTREECIAFLLGEDGEPEPELPGQGEAGEIVI